MAKTRYASLSLATPNEEGRYDYDNFGSIAGDPEYPGSATVFLEIDHPERVNDKGYPVTGRAIAVKFRFPPEEGEEDAEEVVVEVDGCYVNATFWKQVAAKPRKG